MAIVSRRKHTNGWTAVVESWVNVDDLVGYAVDPEGNRYSLTANESVTDDYGERLKHAQEAADRTVILSSGHEDCSCAEWPREGAQ